MWISVEDALPNHEQQVWVSLKFKGESKSHQGYAVWCKDDGWWFELDNMTPLTQKYTKERDLDLDFGEVTHWQPLPKPPKG